MGRLRLVLMSGLLLVLAAALVGCSVPAPVPQAAAAAVERQALPETVDPATVRALLGREGVFVMDVREQSEYDAGHIPGVKLIPMNTVAARLADIPRDKTVIVTCRSGNRSGQVTEFLRQRGYESVHNMRGGILAWQEAGYPVEK